MTARAALFTLLALYLLPAFGAGDTFPSAKNDYYSPDRRWHLRCVTTIGGNEDGCHTLYLRRQDEWAETTIFNSCRWGEVLWQRDGERLAITDWYGSNASEIYLMELKPPFRAVPIAVRNVSQFVTISELNGHCYWQAIKWETADCLLIRLDGHTDEAPGQGHGFTYDLAVDLRTRLATLRRKQIEH